MNVFGINDTFEILYFQTSFQYNIIIRFDQIRMIYLTQTSAHDVHFKFEYMVQILNVKLQACNAIVRYHVESNSFKYVFWTYQCCNWAIIGGLGHLKLRTESVVYLAPANEKVQAKA